jgi:hypothetical protein
MNFSKIKKFTFAMTLALGLAGALGVSSLAAVQAQRMEPRRMEPRKVSTMQQRSAFREGFHSGAMDARRGLRPNPNRHQGFRMGDRLQRRDFRMGYERGFRRV